MIPNRSIDYLNRLGSSGQSQGQSAQRRSIEICQQSLLHYHSVASIGIKSDLIKLLHIGFALQIYSFFRDKTIVSAI